MREGISRFSVKSFCLTVLKNFLAKPFCVSQSFCYREILWIGGGRGREGEGGGRRAREGGKITIFCQKLLSHSAKKFRRETLLWFAKFLLSKRFMNKRRERREGGNITNFCQKFLSHSAKKIRRKTLLCFEKFQVSKNVKDWRGGVYHDFPSKLFCLTVPKHFAVNPLVCH